MPVEAVVLDCSRVDAGKEGIGSEVAGVYTVDKSGEHLLFTKTRVDYCWLAPQKGHWNTGFLCARRQLLKLINNDLVFWTVHEKGKRGKFSKFACEMLRYYLPVAFATSWICVPKTPYWCLRNDNRIKKPDEFPPLDDPLYNRRSCVLKLYWRCQVLEEVGLW